MELCTVHDVPAACADHAIAAAVQIDEPFCAGRSVEHVDVLGDDSGDDAAMLQVGERIMPSVRKGSVGP